MIFAGIGARIYASALTDSLNESNGLVSSHRATGIMSILFEIEHQQNTRISRGRTSLRPGIGYNTEKMVSLPDRISRVGVMIRAPQQAGLERSQFAIEIFRIALKPRIGRFMNHPDNAFTFHRGKIRPHHVVM